MVVVSRMVLLGKASCSKSGVEPVPGVDHGGEVDLVGLRPGLEVLDGRALALGVAVVEVEHELAAAGRVERVQRGQHDVRLLVARPTPDRGDVEQEHGGLRLAGEQVVRGGGEEAIVRLAFRGLVRRVVGVGVVEVGELDEVHPRARPRRRVLVADEVEVRDDRPEADPVRARGVRGLRVLRFSCRVDEPGSGGGDRLAASPDHQGHRSRRHTGQNPLASHGATSHGML